MHEILFLSIDQSPLQVPRVNGHISIMILCTETDGADGNNKTGRLPASQAESQLCINIPSTLNVALCRARVGLADDDDSWWMNGLCDGLHRSRSFT